MYYGMLQQPRLPSQWLGYDASLKTFVLYYNMTVWILAQNDINFSMAAGLISLHMPGVK